VQGAEKTKRAHEASPKEAPAKKRSVFGDITNAVNQAVRLEGKKDTAITENSHATKGTTAGVYTRLRSKSVKVSEKTVSSGDKSIDSSSFENISVSSVLSDANFGKVISNSTSSSGFTVPDTSTSDVDVELLSSSNEADSSSCDDCTGEKFIVPEVEKILPEGVKDVDTDPDPFAVSEYAESIFRNMKSREKLFQVGKYMEDSKELTPGMRAILIDWLVEVQENFELYHETLYLAVRIVDLYLQKKETEKQNLQLVGATAMLIAAKIEERYPPPLDDFVFICDDAYVANDFIKTELDILDALNYSLGIPISYRFLRRFSRVAGASMELLTLARYILESSLLQYEFVDCSPSKIAAAALLLAFKMKRCHEWDKTLVYHTGHREEDLKELLYRLNRMISEPPKASLNTVHSKYSHPVFSEVAKIPPITFAENSH